jgi:hypothetical protein
MVTFMKMLMLPPFRHALSPGAGGGVIAMSLLIDLTHLLVEGNGHPFCFLHVVGGGTAIYR